MRNNIWNIIKKECDRLFKDKRLVVSTIFLPALLIYSLYSLTAAGALSMTTVADDYLTHCYVQNMPDSFVAVFDALEFEVTEAKDMEAAKAQIADKKADLLVVFPADFDVALSQPGQSAAVPNIMVYYNSTEQASKAAYTQFLAAAEQFETNLVNILDINRDVMQPDLATEHDLISTLLSTTLPMLIVMMLFSGCSSVTMDAIVGEKERGTIATLLVTPVSRSHIAIGKIASLSLFALLSGMSSFMGIMLSLPKVLMSEEPGLNMNIYGLAEYAGIFCVIISTVLLIVGLISVISAYAKNVKQASAICTPIMMISSMLSVIQMFPVDFSWIGWKCIPLLNTCLTLTNIFAFEYSAADIAVTCLCNVAYMLVLVGVLSKMFNSEKIMFNK